jgi:hypothetical protein
MRSYKKTAFSVVILTFVSICAAVFLYEHFVSKTDLTGQYADERFLRLKLREPNARYNYSIPDYKFESFNQTIEDVRLENWIEEHQYQFGPYNNCGSKGLRMLFLGSSTTENNYLPMMERFPNLVAESLADEAGGGVCVYNYGVGGSLIQNARTIFFAYGPVLNPDIVFTKFNGTDLGYLIRHGRYDHFRDGEKSIFVNRTEQPLSMFGLVKEIARSFFPKTYLELASSFRGAGKSAYSVNQGPISWDKEEIYDSYEGAYLGLLNEVKLSGAIPVVLLEARSALLENFSYQRAIRARYSRDEGIDYDAFFESHQLFNERLKNELSAQGVMYIDLSDLNSDDVLYDEGHHNAKGNKIIAERINSLIRSPEMSSLLLRRPKRA